MEYVKDNNGLAYAPVGSVLSKTVCPLGYPSQHFSRTVEGEQFMEMTSGLGLFQIEDDAEYKNAAVTLDTPTKKVDLEELIEQGGTWDTGYVVVLKKRGFRMPYDITPDGKLVPHCYPTDFGVDVMDLVWETDLPIVDIEGRVTLVPVSALSTVKVGRFTHV